MRDDVATFAPDLLERVVEMVGEDPFPRVAHSTRFAQPAIFCSSVARLRAHGHEWGAPDAAAGHSLGELAALVSAGAVELHEALELVVLRGRLMAGRQGTMLALLGAPDEGARDLAREHGVAAANFNAPGQVVLSGDREALGRLARSARDAGWTAIELGVAGAFHSPAMMPAVAPFGEALRAATWREPAFPVISCASARPFTDPPRQLAEALTAPVRWTATVRALVDLGVQDFVDVGPGGVLAKLVRRTLTGQPAHA